jgi:predicted GNAT family N-acyltransferase
LQTEIFRIFVFAIFVQIIRSGLSTKATMTFVPLVTTADWEAYFRFRWEVLRAPWGKPLGSERDELECDSFHAVLSNGMGIVAAGRLHFNTPTEAQIRYMCVGDGQRGNGLGAQIIQRLEEVAQVQGALHIKLNARQPAVPFYLRNGYQDIAEGELLWGQIPHRVMQKWL